MFASDYDFPNRRTLLLTPVLETLWSYTKLGPMNLEQKLKPVMTKVDALEASYLAARAARNGAASKQKEPVTHSC